MPEEKKVQRAPVAKSIEPKSTKGRQIAKSFFVNDLNTVENHVLNDIVLPTVKNTLVNVITDAVSMLILGGAPAKKPQGSGLLWTNPNTTPYSTISSSRAQRPAVVMNQPNIMRQDYSTPGFEPPYFETKEEAQNLKEKMDDIFNENKIENGMVIPKYPYVSYLEMYDLCYHPTIPNNDNYGWNKDLWAQAAVVRDYYNNAWTLRLPPAIRIDRRYY